MPSLMSENTYSALNRIRSEAVRKLTLEYEPAGVFVPWAGAELKKSGRGLYFVGIALKGEGAYGDGHFQSRLENTESFAKQAKPKSSFWDFVDDLCVALLGARNHEIHDRWGWSNLLKIAGNEGGPSAWPRELIDIQARESRAALEEEFAQLQDSLIVIMSWHDYNTFPGGLQYEEPWDTSYSHTYFYHQKSSGNLFAHCNHPRYIKTRMDTRAAIVEYARRSLAPF